MSSLKVLETNILHASDVIFWLDGTTAETPSDMLRIAQPLALQLTTRPRDLLVVHGSGKTAFMRRPGTPIINGSATAADKQRPVQPTFAVAGIVSDPEGRYVPRRFSIVAGNGVGHGLVVYPTPLGTRISPAGGLIGTLRFNGSKAPVPWARLTLIALLAGLDRPDRGRLVVNGADLVAMDEAQLTRFRAKNIGIVFQQFHLMPHLSAEENIRLPLELLGRPCRQETIDKILAQVGLSARRTHLPGHLSGGECQRVAIARALVVEPALLLADEPTGNLDVATGREVSNLLFALVAKVKMTMIVVTHNQELAERCTHRLRLEQGVLR